MQTNISQGNRNSSSTLSSDSINPLTGTLPSEITQYLSEDENDSDYDNDLGPDDSAHAQSILSTFTGSSTVNSNMRAHLEALRHGAMVLKINTKTILSTFAAKKIYSSECRLALRALQEYTKFNRLRGMRIYNLIAKEYHSPKIKKEIIKSLSVTAIAEPTTSCEAILQLLRYGGDFDTAVKAISFSSISEILHTNAKGERGYEYVAYILKNVNSVTSCILDAFPMIFKHTRLTFSLEDLWKDVVYRLLVIRELEIAHSIVKANPELLSVRSFTPLHWLFRNGHSPAATVMLAMLAEKALIISSDCIKIYGWCKENMNVDQMTLLADYRLVKALFRSSLRVSRQMCEDFKALHARIFLNEEQSGRIASTLSKRDVNIYFLYCSVLHNNSNSVVNEISKLSQIDSDVINEARILWSFVLHHPNSISELEKLSIPEKSSMVLACRITGQNVWHSLAEHTVIYQLMESQRSGNYSLMQSAKYAIYETVPVPPLIPTLVSLCFSANHSISMGAMHLLNYTISKNTGDFCRYFIDGILSVDYSVPTDNNLDRRRVSLALFPEVWNLLKRTTSLESLSIFRIIVAHDQFKNHTKSLLLECARHPRVDLCEFDELWSTV